MMDLESLKKIGEQEGVSVSLSTGKKQTVINISVDLPSGRVLERSVSARPAKGEDAVKTAIATLCAYLLSFPKDRGLDGALPSRFSAPNEALLADVSHAYRCIDAFTGAILRAGA